MWSRRSGCHATSCLPETNPQCEWIEMAAHRCLVWSWTVDLWRGYWPVAKKTSSMCPWYRTLWVQLVNWQCWFCSYYLLHSVWLVWLIVASLVSKSCQQRWPIHSCSFYKVVHQQIWGVVVDLGYTWSQLISVCNSERIIKIGQYLPVLCSNEKGSSFSWPKV